MKTMQIMMGLTVGLLVVGCATSAPEPIDDGQLSVGPEDPEAGKSFFLPTDGAAEGKFDAIAGSPGLRTSVDRSPTAVWEIRNQWTDTNTVEGKLAGMAWGENSGLTWNAKYAAWIESMNKIDSITYFKTYELTTPHGKALPAPALECAETSIFFRVAFASWYGLPFFMEAKDSQGQRLYLGHFGFRTAAAKYERSANFKRSYTDHSELADTWQTAGWPQDAKLRGRRLGGSQDDAQDFLFPGAHAGAYFDEIFLNKRVGHFMIYALSYFGSMNIADSRNTYNIAARAVRPGDTLLERWQRRGIGHTLVVKHVEQFAEDAYEVALVSGSMPRRQGKWDETTSSRRYFTNETAGGPGANSDGQRYAQLGGGLKRWRVAQVVGGRWANMVPTADGDVFISSRDYDTLAERVAIFGAILKEVSPEEKRAVLLAAIEDQRNHLRLYPASCSARIRREEAFDELYAFELAQSTADTPTSALGTWQAFSADAVDAEHRRLEDYVFAELTYEKSKTCCWNSTTAAMYEIVMAYNTADQAEGEAAGECRPPVVFMNRDGGYAVFQRYAESIGRGDEWVDWSEDESCAQRDVRDDTEAEHRRTAYCDNDQRNSEPESSTETPAPVTDDAYEPNDVADDAVLLTPPVSVSATLCGDNEDWFEIVLDTTATITTTFSMAQGDIDIALSDFDGEPIGSGQTSTDDEQLILADLEPGSYLLKVFHYGEIRTCQGYELSVH